MLYIVVGATLQKIQMNLFVAGAVLSEIQVCFSMAGVVVVVQVILFGGRGNWSSSIPASNWLPVNGWNYWPSKVKTCQNLQAACDTPCKSNTSTSMPCHQQTDMKWSKTRRLANNCILWVQELFWWIQFVICACPHHAAQFKQKGLQVQKINKLRMSPNPEEPFVFPVKTIEAPAWRRIWWMIQCKELGAKRAQWNSRYLCVTFSFALLFPSFS